MFNNNNCQDTIQHFAALKIYYQAEQCPDLSPSNLLYFILRKVDLGIVLNDLECFWLQENNLFNTIKCIESKPKHLNEVLVEANKLFQKYLPSTYATYLTGLTKESLSQPIHFLLKKLDMGHLLTPREISYLNNNGYPQLGATAEFHALKDKYQVTQYPDSQPSSPLFTILKQLNVQGSLSLQQIEWLQSQQLPKVFAVFEQQEHSRNLEFTELKERYQAGDYTDTSYLSRPLYGILQQLRGSEPISEQQIDWLRRQGLLKTIAIAEGQKFERLKRKYKITVLQESSISTHLYKVLKKIDAEDSLSESDFNFLNKRKLIPILDIYVQLKIKRNYELTEFEYNWLAQQSKLQSKLFDEKEIRRYLVSKKLRGGKRLDEIETVWLYNDNYDEKEAWLIRYHEIEALFYENEFSRTNNQWNLANASSHWRKAGKPTSALVVTNELDVAKIKEDKLKSALLTTRGGAFRDLRELDQAESCAKKAIRYYPQSHHPYTLMGAICFECGQYGEGEEWFEKAVQRGASSRDQDAELKHIVKNTKEPEKRRKLIDYLLGKDSERYDWAKKYLR